MKIIGLFSLLGSISLFAADFPAAPRFESTTVGLPALTLMDAAPLSPKIPMAVPPSAPPLEVESFHWLQDAKTKRTPSIEIRRPSRVSPSPAVGVLIGRSSDREKLIEEFKAHATSKKEPNQALEPTAPSGRGSP